MAISNIRAVEAVLNLAWWLRWVTETKPPNRGEAVDAIIRVTGLNPDHPPPGLTSIPWCACFVAASGYGALKDLWPMAKVAGCQSLSDDALKKKLRRLVPSRGAIFLLWSKSANRFHHCGFCLDDLGGGKWRTVEGNTNAGGSPEGTGVFIRERTFAPEDRFIAWAEDPTP